MSDEEQGQADGSPPDPDTEALQAQVTELRQKLTTQSENMADKDELLERLQTHPDFGNIKSYLLGQEPEQEDTDGELAKELQAEGFEEKEATVLGKVFGRFISKQGARLSQNVNSKLSQVSRAVGGSAYQTTLAEAGVNIASPDHRQAMEKLEKDEVYQTLKKANPKQAATYAAREIEASQGTDQSRVQRAREDSLERRGSSGFRAGSKAGKVKINQNDPNENSLANIFDNLKEGREIEFVHKE